MLDVTSHHRPDLDSLVTELKDELQQDYAPPHIKRHAHPKMHGCVQAVLRIDAQVPDELRHGVFAEPGREYRARVRFSNALGIEHDLKFINRGMAIKLLDVKGERLLPHDLPFMLETGTQDFVLATGDAFVLPTAANYAEVATAARAGFPSLVMALVKRKLWRGLAAMVRAARYCPDPLALPYFSQTPHRLGPNRSSSSRASVPDAALVQSLPGAFQFGRRRFWPISFWGSPARRRSRGAEVLGSRERWRRPRRSASAISRRATGCGSPWRRFFPTPRRNSNSWCRHERIRRRCRSTTPPSGGARGARRSGVSRCSRSRGRCSGPRRGCRPRS